MPASHLVVESLVLWVKVPVLAHLQAHPVGKNVGVVGPENTHMRTVMRIAETQKLLFSGKNATQMLACKS